MLEGLILPQHCSLVPVMCNVGSVASSLPDPLAPLPQQKYYHGALSRVEAEAMLVADGEFLVRESTKRVGQYVLTGMAAGKAQHLLLMDKDGRVCWREGSEYKGQGSH